MMGDRNLTILAPSRQHFLELISVAGLLNEKGRDELFRNTRRFRKLFPGAELRRTSEVDIQNRRHRYTWRITLDGKVLMDGMDVTTINDDGRIERIDGFFGPIRPLES